MTCNDASKFGKAIEASPSAVVDWLSLLFCKMIRDQINLSFNGVGDNEIKNIAKGFKKNIYCSTLILSNNFIHADGCQKLMEEILSNSASVTCTALLSI